MSPNVHRSTRPSELRRRGPCSNSGRSCSSSGASRCVLLLMLPVVLLLSLPGGSVESATATQVGPGAAARRYLGSRAGPETEAWAEAFPTGGHSKQRREACVRRRSKAHQHKTSFVSKDHGNRLHMPGISGIRRPEWLVSVWWSDATRLGS